MKFYEKKGASKSREHKGLWHVERKENGSSMWVTVEQAAISKHVTEPVGIFIWTMEMAWNLAQTLSGYKLTMPEGLLPHQEEMY